MRLYEPLKTRLGRCLRVLIYARYSTDEQKKHSISAQIAKCRKYLAQWGITDADIEVISDAGISGEIVHRPGIDRVIAGIKLRKWDLILAEDSSRLYRNLGACLDLVGGAVDLDIRVILPGDDVDTANDNWKPHLEEAQLHHTKSNAYTRRRIKRTMKNFGKRERPLVLSGQASNATLRSRRRQRSWLKVHSLMKLTRNGFP